MPKKVTIANLQEYDVRTPAVYLPYIYATLRAYSEQFEDIRGAYQFTAPLWRLEKLDRLLERLSEDGPPDVLGFSVYVWNHRNSHRVAKAVKERYPGCLVVFGGPHVPNDPSPYLDEHPWVDVCVHGEGEASFCALLRQMLAPEPDLSKVPGISYRLGGHQHFTTPAPRLESLDFPCAYTQGYLEPVLEEIRATFDGKCTVFTCVETARGCPYSCSFCDWGMSTLQKMRQFPEVHVHRTFDWVAENRVDGIILNDSNFGIFPRDLDFVEYLAALKKRQGFPRTFLPLGLAKNNKDRAFGINHVIQQNNLDPYGFNVNFSLQSMSQGTLDAIHRKNISLDSYRALSDIYARHGYKLIPDLIFPLPGETLQSFREGYADLASWEHIARIIIYPCTILPNAPMAKDAYREEWGICTRMAPVMQQRVLKTDVDDAEVELVETVVSTRCLSEEEAAEAKVFVAIVNAGEMCRLLRPLRAFAGRALGLAPHAFYERLLRFERERDGLWRTALDRFYVHALEKPEEPTWMSETPTADGQVAYNHKALVYEALTRKDRFVHELRAFLADLLGRDPGPMEEDMLQFQVDTWITPDYDPADDSCNRFRYRWDWISFLAGESQVPREAEIEVVCKPRATWMAQNYRRARESWLRMAWFRFNPDTFCYHDLETREVHPVAVSS